MSDMFVWFSSIIACFIVVLAGLEPATSPMWTVRSNQLNYKTLCTICPLCPLFPICPLCDSKVSFSTASNTSISCVFVWIFAFFRGLNVHCVQYFHGVFFWLQHFCNTYRLYLCKSRVSEIENRRNYRPILLSSLRLWAWWNKDNLH